MANTTLALRTRLKILQMDEEMGISEQLLLALDLEESNCPKILNKLLESGIHTWGDLLGLRSREHAFEILGNTLMDDAIILFTRIWQYQLDSAPTAPSNSSNVVNQPDDLQRFDFLPRSERFRENCDHRTIRHISHFIKPPEYEQMKETLVKAVEGDLKSQTRFVTWTGPILSGSTSCGLYLMNEARSATKAGLLYTFAFISDLSEINSLIEGQNLHDPKVRKRVLAMALCEGLGIQLNRKMRCKFSLDAVDLKFQLDFGVKKTRVFLQIDEFAQHPQLVRAILQEIAEVNSSPEDGMKIIPVLTGPASLIDISTPAEDAQYSIALGVIHPVEDEAEMHNLFASMRGMAVNKVKRQPRLQNLIADCGGHAGLLRKLVESMDRLGYSAERLEKELLKPSQAETIYRELVRKVLQVHYNDNRCQQVWSGRDFPVIRAMLCQLFLDVVNEARVGLKQPIIPRMHEIITYGHAQSHGIIVLKQHENGRGMQVIMPSIMVSCLNEKLAVLDEVVHLSLYTTTFQVLEQLAMVSLQARMKHLAAKLDSASKNTHWLDFKKIRPGAKFATSILGRGEALSLQIQIPDPKFCRVSELTKCFVPNDTNKREYWNSKGMEANGLPLPIRAGTCYMAAKDQQGFDGMVLYRGRCKTRRKGRWMPCWILMLSQSKMEELFLSKSDKRSTSTVQTNKLISIIEGMRGVEYKVIDEIVKELKKDPIHGLVIDPFVTLYDVFSNRVEGDRLRVASSMLPRNVISALLVTTETDFIGVVGGFLGIRERLKEDMNNEDAENAQDNATKRARKSEKDGASSAKSGASGDSHHPLRFRWVSDSIHPMKTRSQTTENKSSNQ